MLGFTVYDDLTHPQKSSSFANAEAVAVSKVFFISSADLPKVGFTAYKKGSVVAAPENNRIKFLRELVCINSGRWFYF
jgi:hypothetical protein